MSTLQEAFEQRAKADQKVIDALNHLPRTQALSIVLSWIPLKDLEEALPTICGSEEPVKDPVEAFAHRLRIACIHRQLQPMVITARSSRYKDSRSPAEIEQAIREAIKEAIT